MLLGFDKKIKEFRDQWEPELDCIVKKISNSFSQNMEQIRCTGEQIQVTSMFLFPSAHMMQAVNSH